MSITIEEITMLPILQKVALYQLLAEDKEIRNYPLSGSNLMDEFEKRDGSFNNGEMRLTGREELSNLLQNRRNEL